MDIKDFSKEQIQKIVEIFLKKGKKNSSLEELKELYSDNQGLYSIITSDAEKYLICIYDIDANTQKAIYWMDRFTHYGNVEDIFNDEYMTLIIFKRGEKYNNEYLIRHYNRNSGYPMTELVPAEEYPDRLRAIKDLFLKTN